MFRIKTKLPNVEVLTLFFPQQWCWVTIRHVTDSNGKVTTTSSDAVDLFEAGQNHLKACKV